MTGPFHTTSTRSKRTESIVFGITQSEMRSHLPLRSGLESAWRESSKRGAWTNCTTAPAHHLRPSNSSYRPGSPLRRLR